MSQMEIKWSESASLAPHESAVWDVLSTSHRGRAAAVTQAVLSTVVGMSARELRRTIKSLIENHRLPIGSTPHHPAGYFVITSQKEAKAVTRRYYRGALSLLYRMRCLDDISRRDLSDQIEIDLGEMELST